VVEINALSQVTREVVEAARESLAMGAIYRQKGQVTYNGSWALLVKMREPGIGPFTRGRPTVP
jgi:hypothetical protein